MNLKNLSKSDCEKLQLIITRNKRLVKISGAYPKEDLVILTNRYNYQLKKLQNRIDFLNTYRVANSKINNSN